MNTIYLIISVAILILVLRTSFCIKFKGFRLCVGSQCNDCRKSNSEVFLTEEEQFKTKDGCLVVRKEDRDLCDFANSIFPLLKKSCYQNKYRLSVSNFNPVLTIMAIPTENDCISPADLFNSMKVNAQGTVKSVARGNDNYYERMMYFHEIPVKVYILKVGTGVLKIPS